MCLAHVYLDYGGSLVVIIKTANNLRRRQRYADGWLSSSPK